MRKFLVIAIPIVALCIFIAVMVSGEWLKRPMGNNDDVPGLINSLVDTVQAGDWRQAAREAEELDNVWRQIVKRVQFSVERDEINYFYVNLARLRGAIMAEDRAGALMELGEAFEHWKDLGR